MIDICAKKHKGNNQSVTANKRVPKEKIRHRLVAKIRQSPFGMTCDELVRSLELPHQTVSARLSELKLNGTIVIVGQRPTRTGCMASVYRVKK